MSDAANLKDFAWWRRVFVNAVAQLAAGEHVGILGPSGSGKTTLWNVLKSGQVGVPEKTEAAERVQRLSIKLRNGEVVHFARALDVPGEHGLARSSWGEVVRSSSRLVFLFDLSRLSEATYEDKIFEQLEIIATELAELDNKKAKKVVFTFVATHCDKCPPDAQRLFPASKMNRHMERPVVAARVGSVRWQFGSLRSPPPSATLAEFAAAREDAVSVVNNAFSR